MLKLKRTFFGVLCATLLAIGVGYAQQSATITLKSGQTITGQLVDLGGSGYTMRVNGQDQNISQNDVAVIDFTGGSMSASDWANFHDTPQIVMRNGQTINGQLTDIGGKSPLRLTVLMSNGTQQFSSNDVSRIVLARPANAPAAGAGANPQATGRTGVNPRVTGGTGVNPQVTGGAGANPQATGRRGRNRQPTGSSQNNGTITVQANQPWTPTGLNVQRGQQVSFSASGTIQLSPDQNDIAGPDGSRAGRRATSAPLRQMLAGALIAKVGDNGRPFAIGSNTMIAMPASGQLFLGVNDDGFNDNTGSFQVTISRQ